VTAAKRQALQLEKIFQGQGDTDDALGMAEERGWQSVQADWYFRAKGQENGHANSYGGGSGPSGRGNGMVAAFAEVAARRSTGTGTG
jgi:hypothetical protein